MRVPGSASRPRLSSPAAVAAALGLVWAGAAAPQDVGLFVPLETRPAETAAAAAAGPGAGDSATIRERLVEIDFSQLAAFGALVSGAAPEGPGVAERAVSASRLRLNLFEDAVVTAVVDRVVPTPSGYALWGSLEGIELGTLTLVVNGTVVTGTVRSPAGSYVIAPAGERFAVRQEDLSRHAPEAEPLPSPPPEDDARGDPGMRGPDGRLQPDGAGFQPPAAARSARRPGAGPGPSSPAAVRAGSSRDRLGAAQTATPDDGSVVDLLVLYTPAARRGAGGTAQIEALIDLRVTMMNQAFADSGVTPRVNVAWREEVDYVEASSQDADLSRLTNRGDGWLDHIHDLRDVYAADIVHLVYERSPSEDVGIAWIPFDLDADSERWGFSVSNRRAYDEIFAHEVGHNMGLNHDRYATTLDPTASRYNKPHPHAYGYVNQQAFEPNAAPSDGWRTIMAYPRQCNRVDVSCPRILRFSNADQTFRGSPLGVPGDAPSSAVDGPADARKTLNLGRTVIANFRPSGDRARCLYRVSPDRLLALEAGGTYELRVTARPGCAWTAAGDDPFLSVTGGASGSGRGTVTWTVAGHTGKQRRAGTLTVAGQTVSVDQIGSETPGLCRRTRQVYEAVVKSRGVAHCWDVADRHLADVDQLNLSSTGVTSLKADDLAGMPNITILYAGSNRLTTLPADIFASTPELVRIDLNDNELTSLPAGVFRGLAALERLWLQRNHLTSLPAGVFDGLSSLKQLGLAESRLTSLPAGVFDGLTELNELFVSYNRLVSLPVDAFDDLSKLTTLWFHQNRIESVSPDQFANLVKLLDLSASTNRIGSISPDQFANLGQLEELHLERNRLARLPAGTFDGLTNLKTLHLGENLLPSFPAALFGDLGRLEELSFVWNRLPTLPAGVFEGLRSLSELRTYANTGSPFPFPIRLVRTDNGALYPRQATIVVEAPLCAPFPLSVGLSSTAGGTLSAGSATIAAGSCRSDPITVTRTGIQEVVVSLGPAPTRPLTLKGNMRPRLRPPLPVLPANAPPAAAGTLPTTTLRMDEGALSLDVVTGFLDPDGDALTYGASSANDAVATASLTGSTLTLTPVAAGSTTVTVTASDVGGSGGTASQSFAVTVHRRRGVTATPGSLALDEGTSASYTVALDAPPSGPVTVSPSAPAGTDVSVSPSQLVFGTGNWNVGQTVTVSAADDNDAIAPAEATVTHAVSGADYASVTAPGVKVKIVETDAPTLSVSAAKAAEGGGTLTFEVTLSQASSSAVTVDYATSDRSGSAAATAGSDYRAVSGTLTFPATSTAAREIAVPVIADSEDEEERETFLLTLSNAVNASLAGGGGTFEVLGTIEDDDDPLVTPSFESARYEVTEGGSATVVVLLDRDPERELTLVLERAHLDGAADADYSGVPSSLTFGSGETRREFQFTATDDTENDDGEKVVLGFATPWPPSVSATEATSVTIRDDDDPLVAASFESASQQVAEGGAATVAVLLDRDPEREVTLYLDLAHQGGATGADYSGVPDSLTFASGETRREFAVTAVDDTEDDDGEAIELRFAAPLPDRVTAVGGTKLAILDDDDAASPEPDDDDIGNPDDDPDNEPDDTGDPGGPGGTPPPDDDSDDTGGPGGPGGTPPPDDAPDDDDDDDDGGPPPGGGGGSGPPRAAIGTDADCEDSLCRARTGERVSFEDTGSGTVRSRLWDFGDGRKSRRRTPVQVWSEPGFYTVTLRPSDGEVESTASLVFLVEAAEPAGTCVADEETRCLGDSRFLVEVEWWTGDGASGTARVVREGTNDSGLFHFFEPGDNWEVLVKVLDGCPVNGHVWVFGASTTDLGYTMRVTDTVTTEVREYGNEPGTPASAIADAMAFAGGCAL